MSEPRSPSVSLTQRRAFTLSFCAIAFVALLGALRVFDPPYGDQALFLLGATKLHAGGVLYRDFWDLKQPGIFVFYLIGGLLFGLSASGVHEFELLWQILFSAALVVALRPSLRNKAVAAVAPVFAVGSYYAGTVAWHLTQVEGLVGLPIFCFIWAAIAALDRRRIDWRLALLSGAAAGVVINWKWLFGAIVVACLLVLVWIFYRKHSASELLRAGTIWLIGFSVPIAVFVVYAIRYGILQLAGTTFFEIPRRLAVELPASPLNRLVRDAKWFFGHFSAILIFAVATYVERRVGVEPAKRAWMYASTAWVLSDLVVFLVQRQSWWLYHLLLLLPPLAILATFGADNLIDLWQNERSNALRRSAIVALTVVAATSALPLAIGPLTTLSHVAKMRPFTQAALLRYEVRTDESFAANFEAARAFRSFADVAGPIYVCGDPNIYLLVGRDQGASINGWLYSLARPQQWASINDDIARNRLPYVFVSTDCGSMLSSWAPGFSALLANAYRIRARTPEGTWYGRMSRS